MVVRIWRRNVRSNVVGWLVGLSLFGGTTWVIVKFTNDGPWLAPIWGVFLVHGYVSWRRGEFSPAEVTVDGTGVKVATRPAVQSWSLRWDEGNVVGLVRDGRDVPYVVFEPADGLERGERSVEERQLAMVMSLPVHARSIRLTDELRTALTPHLADGLRAYVRPTAR